MKNKLFARISCTILALILAGCASGYNTFYKPVDGATSEAIAADRTSPPPAMPIIERRARANGPVSLTAYNKRGYVMIGSSIFNSGRNESETSALKQGQSIGADLVVIFNPEYTGSTTSYVPLTLPSTTTSNTSSSATAYGSGGSVSNTSGSATANGSGGSVTANGNATTNTYGSGAVTAYGNSTTTTYDTKTTYIPITVNRSDYGALFFIKKHFLFGAAFRDLNDTERQELQTNQGVVVQTIVDDSPAFKADVLTGDVIATIDGVTVPNAGGATRMMDERKGKQITLAIARSGQRIEKSIQLDN